MHAQYVVLPFHPQRNRVIQIFRIFSVDGHHLNLPQIHTPLHVRAADPVRHPFCLIHDLFRKFRRDFHPFHNGKHIGSRITHMSQNLQYPAFRTLLFRTVIRQRRPPPSVRSQRLLNALWE